MKTNHPSKAPNYYEQAGNLRSGDRVSLTLLTGIEDDPGNFRLAYGTGGSTGDWTTPRHHHNFEQIRWALEGDYSVGRNKKLPAGWVGYFPESAYYGPQEISQNLTMLLCQFGGPTGLGFASVAQRRRGYDGLIARGGKLEKGLYTTVDEEGNKHNQDAFEAVWEEIYGRQVEYPEPRYDEIILMNPDAFDWIPDDRMSGVAWRHLGTFTEKEIRIAFLRVESGASITFGSQPSQEIVFVKSGSVIHDDVSHPELTAFGTMWSDDEQTLSAESDSELFYMKLPTFPRSV